MQERLIRLSTRALAATWASVISSAFAISLGELEVRSSLGEALDARVPLGLAPGEVVDATCFALARDTEPGVPVVAEGLLTVERAGDRASLRIRSPGSVFEPAVRLRVRAACPGQPGETLRQYSVLLDPRRAEPVVASLPLAAAAPMAAGATAPSAGLEARRGDTLAGLAGKVFPRNAAPRERYLRAMREANPALASLGDADPIPEGANVTLPDLRAFARAAGATERVAAAPSRTRDAAGERPARRSKARSAARAPRAMPETTVAGAMPGANPFVLRLSGNAMDLSRTREVDDRTRAQLRERLMILESDDQVSAVLALRNRLSQLEARVNELQLKLAQMPESFPVRAPAGAREAQKPATSVAVPAPGVVAPAPAPEAAKPEAAAAEAAKPGAATAEAARPEAAPAASAKADGPAVTTRPMEPDKAEAAPAKPSAREKPAPAFEFRPLSQSYGLWAAFIAVIGLMMWLVWRLTHRQEPDYDGQSWDAQPPLEEDAVAVEAGHEPPASPEPLGADAGALRRRYIEERFPEVLNRTLDLDDPASVLKVARLFYEDGAMPRAVELLQFAIEDNPSEVRPWLGLFEIYRLERLTGEFAELARRFYAHFGDSEYWRKIRYFGREIDPGNFLYREDVDAIETINPAAERRAGGERFDPARENWLAAPMDFDNEVLANELRQGLMAKAGVVDQDLVPNPMPALRDAEMFTVA